MMTLEEVVAWCTQQKATVQFRQPGDKDILRKLKGGYVLMTVSDGTRSCYGSGVTFVEAVENCKAKMAAEPKSCGEVLVTANCGGLVCKSQGADFLHAATECQDRLDEAME